MKKIIYSILAAAAVFGAVSCEKNPGIDPNEEKDKAFLAIAENFVNGTVIPTYTNLANYTETLVDQLVAFKESDSRTQADLDEICETFLVARAWWEKSEAFLFGAATDYGIDPHIDTWPLDLEALKIALSNTAQIEAMEGEDGDVFAGENLGQALLGFHGIEYILFEDGQPRNYASIEDLYLTYAVAVAGDLRNRCFQLEVSWAGEDNVADSHIEKVEDLELAYTVAGGELSYGENIIAAGTAGSIYPSLTRAMEAIIDGCKTIADEVGTSKIGKPFNGEDKNYIESPYSYKSITDFYDNMISIQNVYMGGLEGSRNEAASLHGYLSENAPEVDARVVAAIQNALDKISAMAAPFVLNYDDPSAGVAIEACKNLDDILSEAKTAIRE